MGTCFHWSSVKPRLGIWRSGKVFSVLDRIKCNHSQQQYRVIQWPWPLDHRSLEVTFPTFELGSRFHHPIKVTKNCQALLLFSFLSAQSVPQEMAVLRCSFSSLVLYGLLPCKLRPGADPDSGVINGLKKMGLTGVSTTYPTYSSYFTPFITGDFGPSLRFTLRFPYIYHKNYPFLWCTYDLHTVTIKNQPFISHIFLPVPCFIEPAEPSPPSPNRFAQDTGGETTFATKTWSRESQQFPQRVGWWKVTHMKFSRFGWLVAYVYKYIYMHYIHIIHPACFPMEGMVKSTFGMILVV